MSRSTEGYGEYIELMSPVRGIVRYEFNPSLKTTVHKIPQYFGHCDEGTRDKLMGPLLRTKEHSFSELALVKNRYW